MERKGSLAGVAGREDPRTTVRGCPASLGRSLVLELQLGQRVSPSVIQSITHQA